MAATDPPTGIIRCLPAIYADPNHVACQRYQETKSLMRVAPDTTWFAALARQPKHEILHVYIAIGGKIDARFTFVGYRAGSTSRLWDDTERAVAVWAICTGPAEAPPSPIKQRGFQGFRYTTGLW